MNQFKTDIESTIQKYLRKELSDEQLEQFEDHFVDKPEIIEKIELGLKIMSGLNSANEQDLLEAVAQPKRAGMIIKRLLGWLFIPTPAYVSVLVCSVMAVTLLVFNTPMPSHPNLIGFSTAQTRNAAKSVMIDLSSERRFRAVFIKLPKVAYRHYRLRVTEPVTEKLIWLSEPFTFSALRDQMIFLPDELVHAQAKIELLADVPNQAPLSVRFCHYSEVCEPHIKQ